MTIDTHVHVGGKYQPIEDWTATEARLGVHGALLVQNLGNHDNSYLAACLAKGAGRYAAIAIPEDAAEADRLLADGFAGVRLSPQGLHHRPGDESIWQVLNKYGAVASVTGPYDEITDPSFRRLIERYVAVTFRLEHLGWFHYRDLPDAGDRLQPLLALAQHPNTATMWSGYFVNSGEPYPHRDAWPLLEATLEHFGAERIMWSGDWNRPELTDDDYRRDIALIEQLPFVGAADRAAIMHGTAARLFGLPTLEGSAL
jgi:predicted TIM-barrel fold metal-dependent hydrolase